MSFETRRQDQTRFNEVEAGNLSLGQLGFDEVTGTESGTWIAIQAIGADATLSATSNVGDNLSSVTLYEGGIIYGNFSQIVVTSGKVLAYRGI